MEGLSAIDDQESLMRRNLRVVGDGGGELGGGLVSLGVNVENPTAERATAVLG